MTKISSLLSLCLALSPLHLHAFTVNTALVRETYRQTTFLSSASPSSSSGPKAEGRRRVSRRTSASGGSDGPRGSRSRRERPSQPAPFDGKLLCSEQDDNEDAEPLDLDRTLQEGRVRCMTDGIIFERDVKEPPFFFMSLDDLFGEEVGFSSKFNLDSTFRQKLRAAIRQDIFDTTPFYANLSEKAASMLLLLDSSLEGSWRMPESMNRMNQTSKVLSDALGENAPTGDELFHAIGRLCGARPSTHFIDIFGVQDRRISHSFHLDFGKSPENTTQTVLWGWPRENSYDGCGVFSHVIPLKEACWTPEDHPRMEPVLFDGTFDEQNIVRPRYNRGRELLIYRDVDVVHSAPDVAYRTSVMRFM